METITLSKRLLAIAAMVPHGSTVVDVGTDHGYIPAWLIQTGVCTQAYATDIHAAPLQSAVSTAQAAGVDSQITFFHCDGLDDCPADAIDTVIIAGMGGETIAGILERAPWTRKKQMILQPMSKAAQLRCWLITNGYAIQTEQLVRDAGIIYPILTAQGASSPSYTLAELYYGKYSVISQDPLFPEYRDNLMQKLRHALRGLNRAKSEEAKQRCRQIMEIISDIEQYDRRK